MGDMLPGDRWARDLDLPETVTRRTAGQDRDQSRELLAGLLTGEPVERVPRPVTDIAWQLP